MTDTQLIYYEPCEKITRFDVYLADPYCGEEFTRTHAALTLQEVWNFLCDGGDWNFRVTATGHPDKCFLSGRSYHDYVLKDANNGATAVHLCSANEEEMAEIKSKARARNKREEAEARIRNKAKEMIDGSAEKD